MFFFPAVLALTAYTEETPSLIPSIVVNWTLGRILYRLGYKAQNKHNRLFGMAYSMASCLPAIPYGLYQFAKDVILAIDLFSLSIRCMLALSAAGFQHSYDFRFGDFDKSRQTVAHSVRHNHRFFTTVFLRSITNSIDHTRDKVDARTVHCFVRKVQAYHGHPLQWINIRFVCVCAVHVVRRISQTKGTRFRNNRVRFSIQNSDEPR